MLKDYNFINRIVKSYKFYYLIPFILAITFPLSYYPRIYGTDGFQIIWMAQALKEGAFFSENSWLISPFSYFGFYPFSHRAIGVPTFLAFLVSFLEIISFGMAEAILLYNIILIIFSFKTSRNLSKILFKEEWIRFLYIVGTLLSPFIIYRTIMDVDTRIIITILMNVFLKINIEILTHDKLKISQILKKAAIITVLLLIGALAHGLWMALLFPLAIMLFTLVIRNLKNLLKISIFLLIPISLIAFMFGMTFFKIDPLKIWSPFFDNSTLLGLTINLIIHYTLQVGIILLFFPIGIIISLWQLIRLIKKTDNRKLRNEKIVKNFYLLLFLLPFMFMAPSFYTIVIFLPFLIIFSIKGLNYILIQLKFVSETLKKVFPFMVFLLSEVFTILYPELIININLWYLFVILYILLLVYLIVFLLDKFQLFKFNKSIYKIKGRGVLIIAILLFTITTVEGRLRSVDSNSYPWENRYLTTEEIQIIEFFDGQNIEGLIFSSTGILVADRLAGVGFLPTLNNQTLDGKSIYYRFVSPNEVLENTEFTIILRRLVFFEINNYKIKYPIRDFIRTILSLNVTCDADIDFLKQNYVQYIISIDPRYPSETKDQPLICSLPNNLEPIYRTKHFLVWQIY